MFCPDPIQLPEEKPLWQFTTVNAIPTKCYAIIDGIDWGESYTVCICLSLESAVKEAKKVVKDGQQENDELYKYRTETYPGTDYKRKVYRKKKGHNIWTDGLSFVRIDTFDLIP